MRKRVGLQSVGSVAAPRGTPPRRLRGHVLDLRLLRGGGGVRLRPLGHLAQQLVEDRRRHHALPCHPPSFNVKIRLFRTVTPESTQTAKPRPTRSGELRSLVGHTPSKASWSLRSE